MTSTVSRVAERIALRLDRTIAFEALILTRLAQTSASRREEWLRGLMVRGFQSECRSLRELAHETNDPIAGPPRSERLHRPLPTAAESSVESRAEPVVASLTALRKVIG